MNAEQAKRIVEYCEKHCGWASAMREHNVADVAAALQSIGLAEPAPEGAVKLRIPVLIDASGKWFAQGTHKDHDQTNEEARGFLDSCEVTDIDSSLFWIEAVAPPVAPVPVVKGAVSE